MRDTIFIVLLSIWATLFVMRVRRRIHSSERLLGRMGHRK